MQSKANYYLLILYPPHNQFNTDLHAKRIRAHVEAFGDLSGLQLLVYLQHRQRQRGALGGGEGDLYVAV